MPKINILPKHISELIAAGEVVERPASIVKELMENSIDAGANAVTLEIKNGGITYIRITDDGCGISAEDVPKAFLSHATSKIQDESSLNRILTLGFRGEALPSIAAVSKVEMLTRVRGEFSGTRYVIEGGEEKLVDEAGCPDGTTIIVRDIFFNTPARMKFLKKDVSEGNAVAAVVDRIALSHPEVSIRFIRDSKQVLFTAGDNNLLSAIYSVLGKAFSETLISTEYELNGVKIDGFVGKPLAARGSRGMQYFFLNGRFVKSKTAMAALEQAYKSNIMVGKFPVCVININIPPETVDVNVHPAKTEVRFSDEKRIFDAVYYAVKNSIEKDKSSHEIKMDKPKIVEMVKPEPPKQIKLNELYGEVKKEPVKDFWQTKTAAEFKERVSDYKTNQRSFKVSDSGKDSSFVKQEEPSVLEMNSYKEKHDFSKPLPNNVIEQIKSSNQTEYAQENTFEEIENTVEEPETVNEVNENKFEDIEFNYVGEAFDTYIIIEKDNQLSIIDKHAAHERLIYEKLKKENENLESQMLLSPVTVSLSKEEYAVSVESLELFTKSGFEVDDFGDGTVIVRACPVELSESEIEPTITEMAGYLLQHKTDIMPDKLDWLYQNVACRSAIKGGNKTTRAENEHLIKELLKDDNIRYCPHGRPIKVTMTRYELEKQFKRV
ncbi:MAG: DNA mismatch repair endonuclease MutL [Clostridiales bacterium]|nr:DNA mismatch repair endonuclease MutL [Clostridiales bacterium]